MTKLILISGSLRKDSLNFQLLNVCEEILKTKGIEVLRTPQAALNIPIINTDDEHDKFPPTVKDWSQKIIAANGVLIATPEYNGSISPVIKNFVDWTSRLKPHPWKAKNVLLCGTSPGYFGTIKGLLHSRIPFETLGAFVYPTSYALPNGDKNISGSKISDPTRQEMLESLIGDFIKYLR
jgi:chromate reductase